jgi:hypothetical protein
MPIDPSIPLQAQTPSFDTALKPIASMLGIAGAQQQLQTGRLQQTQLAGQVQERENLSKIDWNQFRDKDGNLDAVSAGNAAMQAAPAFYGPALAKQLNEVAKDSITIKQGIQSLNESQRKDISSGLGALSLDPKVSPQKVMDWAAQYSQQNPAAAPLLFTALKHAPSDPAQLKQWLVTSRNSVIPAASQGSTVTPINTGGETQFVQTNQYAPDVVQQVGRPIANTVTPTQAEEIQTDALGNKYIVQRGPNGAILNTRPVPGSYSATGPSPVPSGPANLPPGGDQAIKDAAAEVSNARAVANGAPVMHDLNRSIIAEADKGLNTGALGQLTQKFASATGYNIGSQSATDYNVLGKLLERSALQAAQGMGPHTNAGLDAQVRANGSLDYTPQAIRKIAVLNDALTTGAEHYRTGMEQALQASGQNPTVKRVFDQAWAQNFDPRIMRLENAAASGDKKEIDNVLHELGGPKSKAAQDLRTKAANLQTLIAKGHL